MVDKANILIVDDEMGPRESLKMILKPYFNVYTAERGGQAIEILNQIPIDLVTVDLKMPGLPGTKVLEKGKVEARSKESIYYTYVLNEADELVGAVTLRQLLTVPGEAPVSEFMRKRVVRVRVDTHVQDVADLFLKYDFTLLPVVDKKGRLQGTITMKDAIEAVSHAVTGKTTAEK